MNAVVQAGDFHHLNTSAVRTEQALIGICMMEPTAFTAAQPWLTAHYFSENIHRHIWDAMEGLAEEGRPVTPITVLNRTGNVKIGETSLQVYIARCAADTSCPAPYAIDHARQIREQWCLREIAHLTAEARSEALAPGCQARALLGNLMQKLDETRAVVDGRVTLSRSAGAAADALVAHVNGIRSGDIKDRFVTTGLRDLDRKLNGGFRPGELIIVAGRPGMGKAQPLSAKVLTADGWKRMGDIKVGDTLVHPTSGTSKVVAVHPQGAKPIFRISFHDGRSTECCDDHLWRVKDRHWPDWRVFPLSRMRRRKELFRLSIPLAAAKSPEINLPIAPYVMGALLGDGYFHPGQPMFSSADKQILDRISSLLPSPLMLVFRSRYNYAITSGHRNGGVNPNAVFVAIQTLGLGAARSPTKFIPETFKRAGTAQRLDLLRGLLDTDGTVERDKTIRFSSTSLQLATDVVEVARSLGAWAKIRQRKRPQYTHRGERRIGREAWTVSIRHADPASLFTLDRKIARLGDGGQYSASLKLAISDIAAVGHADCQCITVDNPDGLYFTNDYTITHNSIIAVSCSRQAAKSGHAGALFSLEMPDPHITARLLSDESYSGQSSLTASQIISGSITDTDVVRLDKAQRALVHVPLMLDCSPSLTVGEVGARTRTLMKRLERNGKRLEFVTIDYLKFLRASDRYRGQRVLEVGEITGGLKNLAKELEISIVLLAQLNRQNEQTADKKPDLSHLRDSGEIEQDADVVLLLYREAYYLAKDPALAHDPEKSARHATVANQLDIIVAKNRMGQTGAVTVFCHPGASAVRDLMQGYA